MNNNELSHHGIRGMKWGIRRYQNKDGSFTPAGKKRYEKEMAKLKEEEKRVKAAERTKASIDKLDAKKRELEERKKALAGENDKKPTKGLKSKISKEPRKSAKDLSDEELQEIVTRLKLEARYNELNPEKVSAGKRFMGKVSNSVIVPAATEVGKNIVKKMLENAVSRATKDK